MESRRLLPPLEHEGRAPPVGEQDVPGDDAENDARAACSVLAEVGHMRPCEHLEGEAERLLVAVDAASGVGDGRGMARG
jgi:hypothetical protein